jgi:hypothetical protein
LFKVEVGDGNKNKNTKRKFVVNRSDEDANLIHGFPSPFEHDIMNFHYTYEKKLSDDEIKAGGMVIAAH